MAAPAAGAWSFGYVVLQKVQQKVLKAFFDTCPAMVRVSVDYGWKMWYIWELDVRMSDISGY